MEPLFFKAENAAWANKKRRQVMRFNGAAFFQSGKCRLALVCCSVYSGFNGAAFFQSGKSCSSGGLGAAVWASMEPLFFKAENLLSVRAISTLI